MCGQDPELIVDAARNQPMGYDWTHFRLEDTPQIGLSMDSYRQVHGKALESPVVLQIRERAMSNG